MENGLGKHKLLGDGIDGEIPSKSCTKEVDDLRLQNFIDWCKKSEFAVSDLVKISKEGSCAQYGMVAVQDIPEGSVLFRIPRSFLLFNETSAISELLLKEAAELQSESGWVPLLLSLMYESNNAGSKWMAYLELVPDFKELDLPMFWALSDRESLLRGSGVNAAVDRDMCNITKEFNTVVLPFVRKHQHVFSANCQDIEFYKKMVAFVMSYSFTEPADETEDKVVESVPKSPMMVPVADILNHVAKNNAHLVFVADCLKMVAIRSITKGEEVFNTYGQVSNYHLLHMYGFAEQYPNNHYETVDISMKMVFEAAKSLTYNNHNLLEEKWKFLQAMDLSSDDVFIVGVEGILTEDEMYNTLKVLAMTEQKFTIHKEKEGWSDDNESLNSQDESLTFDKLASLPDDWKLVLASCAKVGQTQYASSLTEDEEALYSGKVSQMPPRNRFSFFTCYSQKKLLQKVIESCR